jgi:hypothetical protein
LSELDKILNKERLAFDKCKQLKQALMSDLLTGKVPVKYEEDKVEVV